MFGPGTNNRVSTLLSSDCSLYCSGNLHCVVGLEQPERTVVHTLCIDSHEVPFASVEILDSAGGPKSYPGHRKVKIVSKPC